MGHENLLDQWSCAYCYKPISVSPHVSSLQNCSCHQTLSNDLLEQAPNIEFKKSAKELDNPSSVGNTVAAASQWEALEYDGPKYVKATETRPRLGKKEVDILEASFRKNPKPTSQTKRRFAEETGVDLARINNWFQNRRAKRKQEKKQEEYEARHAQDPPENLGPSSLAGSYTPQHADPSQASMESLQRAFAVVRTTNRLSPKLDIYGTEYHRNEKPIPDETASASATTLENISVRNSISVEDETDWDGVSSRGSSIEKIALQMVPVKMKGEKDSLCGQQLTAAQLSLIYRLMEEFWVIFNDSWQSRSNQYGSTHSGSPSESSSSMLEAPGFAKSNSISSKRPRQSENGDSDIDKSRPSKRKGKEPQGSDPSKVCLRFACPFRKRDSRKYCVQTWRACALTPHTTIARVKAHLYAYHLIHQCQRCKDVFNSETDLDLHIEAPEPCQSKTAEPVDGITNKIRAKLQSRKKAHPQQTEAERWKQIYEILFQPEADEIIPSPYFEPIKDGEGNADTSSHHRDFANYEAYLRRELPRTFNAVLERAVRIETNPIEERLRGQLQDMIQEAQNQAFASWRALQRSESSIPMPQENGDPVYLFTRPSASNSDIPSNSESSEGIAVSNHQDTPELKAQEACSISDAAEPRPFSGVDDGNSLRGTGQDDLTDFELIDIDWAINLGNCDTDFPQEESGKSGDWYA